MIQLTILSLSLKFAQYIYSKSNTYQVLVSLDVNTYLKHALMQKNNMGIIGNDMEKNKNNR